MRKKRPYVPVEIDRRFTHGQTNSPTYGTWTNMLNRCENSRSSQFKRYGGRGIRVCEQWHDFAVFLRDVGERPSLGHTLDRFPDPDGHYEPGNVRWATQQEQCRNKAGNRKVVRSDGLRFNTIAEAAESTSGTCAGIWDVCNDRTRSHRGYGWRYE